MSRESGRVRYFVRTNAECLDPSLGVLLDKYLRESLSDERRLEVRAHLRRCVSCAAYVFNSKAVAKAAAGRPRSGSVRSRARRGP
jgi:anti-sigma factor RsiW